MLAGRKEQTVPVVFFPVSGFLEVLVLPFLLFKFRVMALPGSVFFVGRNKLVTHFMINGEFQNALRHKVLLQPWMNPDEFFSPHHKSRNETRSYCAISHHAPT